MALEIGSLSSYDADRCHKPKDILEKAFDVFAFQQVDPLKPVALEHPILLRPLHHLCVVTDFPPNSALDEFSNDCADNRVTNTFWEL